MRKIKYIRSVLVLLTCAFVLTTSNICTDFVTAQPVVQEVKTEVVQKTSLSPMVLVASPKTYLGQNVTFDATFDKFSTLGLDYKPAFKSSESYISFLVKREDTSYDIPLSEMKLFLKREDAEKFIDLKTNDKIQITGNVFSDALGDVWIDVSKLVLIKKAPEKENGV